MECTTLQEDVLYSQNTSKLTPESIAAIQNTVQRSQPVGVVVGLYDEALTITDVSGFFLKTSVTNTKISAVSPAVRSGRCSTARTRAFWRRSAGPSSPQTATASC